MATTQFVELSWSPDQIIEDDMLQQLNDNSTWMRNRMVTGAMGSTSYVNRLKFQGGRVKMPAQKNPTKSITFPIPFNATPTPVVTVTPHVSTSYRVTWQVTSVTATGFSVRLQIFNAKGQDIKPKNQYPIMWQAMGIASAEES